MNSIADATKYLEHYWSTYDTQLGYETYSVETFLLDAVYGIGASMSDDYKMGSGCDRFRQDLIEFLQTGDWNPKEEEK